MAAMRFGNTAQPDAAARKVEARATRGPFGTVLVGYEPALNAYKIQVQGLDGQHRVFRQYDCFARLRAHLSKNPRLEGVELPALPPRRIGMGASKAFMLSRAADLCWFLYVAVDADPFLTTQALQDFLEVRSPSSTPQRPKGQKVSSYVQECSNECSNGDSNAEDNLDYPLSTLLSEVNRTEVIESGENQPLCKAPGRLQLVRACLCAPL